MSHFDCNNHHAIDGLINWRELDSDRARIARDQYDVIVAVMQSALNAPMIEQLNSLLGFIHQQGYRDAEYDQD